MVSLENWLEHFSWKKTKELFEFDNLKIEKRQYLSHYWSDKYSRLSLWIVIFAWITLTVPLSEKNLIYLDFILCKIVKNQNATTFVRK